ncbi:hypothetical protein R3W88_016486 [Solanum pinnatisectum]|uniref:Uncharacterized protein n=1 Tax=Solanum pinnatisectum TaxID=50273 RepID=A0AAV9KXP0_9SOLN|nr:hypothetical protein R3W88_016486 [Solanum pinnatisectum]
MVLSSPPGKLYSFVHPTNDAVLNHIINLTTDLDLGAQLNLVEARNKVIQTNDRLNELDARENAAKEKMCSIDQMNDARDHRWWESMDQFNAYEITKFEALLNTTEGFLNIQLKQVENGASSSLHFPQKDGHN